MSELRRRNTSDESQLGVICREALSRSTFCPVVLDGLLLTVDESAALDRVTLELAAGFLDRFLWGRTERGAAFISISWFYTEYLVNSR